MSCVCVPRSATHPFIEHDDLVGVDDRRQPMRDHERRMAARDLAQPHLNFALRARIERGRRFVEQQDPRTLENRARDRDALFLAARKLEAALTDFCLIAVGEAMMKS
jgi:hypothetical protein